MNKQYSNGKLLLTGEYLVLDGAKSLAVPTKFGQDLIIEPIQESELIWGSFTHTGECWFEASFSLPKLRLTTATFNSEKEGSNEFIAETLLGLLKEAQRLNPEFLNTKGGFIVKTNLSFPRDWGLGSSSTLINNIASWAKVNPYELLWNAFSGSGYDVACAKHNSPIFYTLAKNELRNRRQPIVEEIGFNPEFTEELYFVHLNQKQDSREGIQHYKTYIKQKDISIDIKEVAVLSDEFIKATTAKDLMKLITEHERLVGGIIQMQPVKNRLFSDYFGAVKSLGAWGGDFILVTGNDDTPKYFKEKGYATILSYKEMIL